MTDSHIHIAPDVLFQDIDGEGVLLNLATEKYFSLDDIGTHMWQLLEQHGHSGPVVDQLTLEYDADRKTIARDLTNLINKLLEAGLVNVTD